MSAGSGQPCQITAASQSGSTEDMARFQQALLKSPRLEVRYTATPVAPVLLSLPPEDPNPPSPRAETESSISSHSTELVPRYHHLRNALAQAEFQKPRGPNYAESPATPRDNPDHSRRRVRKRESHTSRPAAAGTNLRLISDGSSIASPGRNQLRFSRADSNGLHAVQVHTCVFHWVHAHDRALRHLDAVS